jgi:hypothetical protein
MMSLLLGFYHPGYATGDCYDLFACLMFLIIDNAARVRLQSLLMATDHVADAYFDDKCHCGAAKKPKDTI